MSREPDWYRAGFETAAGYKKSKMSLPEDFFEFQFERMFREDFNVVVYAHEYAVNWLETEQWNEEVGQKARKFVTKYYKDDMKVDVFMEKAFQWADGYANYIIEQFHSHYIASPHEIRSKLSCEAVRKLIELALSTAKQETGEKKSVTRRSNKSS